MDFTSINEIQATTRADQYTSRLDAAKRLADAAGVEHGEDEARVAGEAFEKLFATLLVREMSATLQDGFFGDGPGADTFNGWLEEQFGAALADDGALGLAEAVRASILQKQGAADAQPDAEERP
jgi:Rod binding domain-containing protein